jgi:uncharacterized protein YyaL (SSP411 family)
MANRLINESSLYLRQHAHNPVDWYPWGPEALQRSKELDRPIFLSIGYSACHWCHVMERESFEDQSTAQLLNAHFVSIKVDREERPDIDTIYMTALQAMTQEGGGWPLSVWLTPDLHPFYAGTYFPPANRYGRPGFPNVLRAIADAWTSRRADINQQSAEIVRFLNERGSTGAAGELGPDLLTNASSTLRRAFDPTNGGFGRAPKFPHAIEIRLLLRIWKRFGDNTALHMVRHTLDRMAAGGMYDQIGGGFHRYSTDARWLVPHFEKMLYDNALLASAYVEAWQATHEPEYRRVAEETLNYVLREMTDAACPFYSTQDADSEGVEGKFYVWSHDEIVAELGADNARILCAVYDISPTGNWEGQNIPNRPKTWDLLARELGMPKDDLLRRCRAMADTLYDVRGRRVWPGRDEKILTAWNGLMIAAMAQAGATFDSPRYTGAAAKAAEYVLANLRKPNGRLYRTAAVASAPKIDAYLEDYAFLIGGLLSLYQADFDPHWVQEAVKLADVMVQDFADPAGGGFYFTASGHEPLITRTKDSHDGSTPSGNAMAVTALQRLAVLAGRTDFGDLAAMTLGEFAGLMREAPAASGQMLLALDFYLGSNREVAVIGQTESEPVRSVLRSIRERFVPNALVAFHDPAVGEPAAAIPLLQDRPAQGDVTTYVCENFACQAPLVGAESAVRAIEVL